MQFPNYYARLLKRFSSLAPSQLLHSSKSRGLLKSINNTGFKPLSCMLNQEGASLQDSHIKKNYIYIYKRLSESPQTQVTGP